MMRAPYSSLAAVALVASAGCTSNDRGGPPSGDAASESPEVASITAADLTRTWATLAVPQAGEAPSIVRTGSGFVALAREQTPTGSKAIGEVYNYLYRSEDGVRWRRVALPAKTLIYGKTQVVYGAGRYLLLERGGGDGELWTSTDLAEWSKPALPEDRDGGDVAPFNPWQVVRVHGLFVGLAPSAVFASRDGVSWSRAFLPLVQGRGIAHGNGVFLIHGALSILSSRDGFTWAESAPAGPTGNVVFLDGAFYADHATSTDGVQWNTYDGPIATDAVGGYLFEASGARSPTGTASSGLRAWRPGEAARVISTEPAVPSERLAGGIAPEEIISPLPGGETCTTHRCVIVNGALYLIR